MADNVRIALIDYGMGNLRSVTNALHAVGVHPVIAASPRMLCDVHGIILPGVGAFPSGMNNLRRLGFAEVLEQEVMRGGKSMLGICLGMQLLATVGHEHISTEGLNFVPGEVVRLAPPAHTPNLRIPHIGWNDLQICRENGLYANIPNGENFYFVHSYAFAPGDPSVVSASCHYGVDFAASLEMNNISAVQFHPEKSHQAGIRLLGNWLRKVKRC